MFKIRASKTGAITTGSMGLTEEQNKEYLKLVQKESLTPIQTEKFAVLLEKKKNPQLPQGAKTYCKSWLKEKVYNRKKEFYTKHTEKGIIMEDESLEMISDVIGCGMLLKNDEQFENEFMTGMPDVILPNIIIDAKNSWDFSTFPLFETEIPDSDYWWQGQTYMALTGRDHYNLIYVLSDTPMHLIENEAWFWAKKYGYRELEADMLEKFFNKMTYTDTPNNMKVKEFKFDRDNKAIELIESRVIECRKYIDSLLNNTTFLKN